MRHHGQRSAPNLLIDVVQSFSNLVQTEVSLARAEMASNASRAMVGLACLGVAALLVLTALNLIAGAFVAVLTEAGLAAASAGFVVAGCFLVLAIVLAAIAKSRLTASALLPKKTIDNVKRDIAAAKGASDGAPD